MSFLVRSLFPLKLCLAADLDCSGVHHHQDVMVALDKLWQRPYKVHAHPLEVSFDTVGSAGQGI